MRWRRILLMLGCLLVLVVGTIGYVFWPRLQWRPGQVAALRGLSLVSLPALPSDPSNRVADDPRAAALGHQLFFDGRFSANGAVSCATCHVPGKQFTDGLPQGKGLGTTARRTPTIVGTAYQPWFFWDGRKDSQWAQALGPLESAVEHGGTRTQYAHLIATYYRTAYEALFGPLPDLADRARFPDAAGPVADPVAHAAWERMTVADRAAVTQVYVNLGKAIAAYERRIVPGPSRFDRYVQALVDTDLTTLRTVLTRDEVAGARLFIGKGQCINCHNGPLLADNSFHNIGVPDPPGVPHDVGRAAGAKQVLADEFNCVSRWSDAKREACAELRFLVTDDQRLLGAFKPPTLRNIAETAPYMHAGQFKTLREVLAHYNRAAPGAVGHSELKPLQLSARELAQLEAFLRTLSGGIAAPRDLLGPPHLPAACQGCHPAVNDERATTQQHSRIGRPQQSDPRGSAAQPTNRAGEGDTESGTEDHP